MSHPMLEHDVCYGSDWAGLFFQPRPSMFSINAQVSVEVPRLNYKVPRQYPFLDHTKGL